MFVVQHLVKQPMLAKVLGQLAGEGLPTQRLSTFTAAACAEALAGDAARVTLLQALCQALPLGMHLSLMRRLSSACMCLSCSSCCIKGSPAGHYLYRAPAIVGPLRAFS